VHVPDLVVQLASGDGLARPKHEVLQELELRMDCEADRLRVARHARVSRFTVSIAGAGLFADARAAGAPSG